MRAILVVSGLLLATGSALAADPVGEWLVKDRSARMKIVSCPQGQTQALWGVIWAQSRPGFDTANRDPSMKGRPLLGIPILIDMRQTRPNRWEGKIYDPKGTALISGGGIYDANVILIVKPDRLRYWIRSVAIRDADETLHDLRRQGF